MKWLWFFIFFLCAFYIHGDNLEKIINKAIYIFKSNYTFNLIIINLTNNLIFKSTLEIKVNYDYLLQLNLSKTIKEINLLLQLILKI